MNESSLLPADVSLSDSQQGLQPGEQTVSLFFNTSIYMDLAACLADSSYMCFYVRAHPEQASFSDSDVSNNIRCQGIPDLKECYPGKTNNVACLSEAPYSPDAIQCSCSCVCYMYVML